MVADVDVEVYRSRRSHYLEHSCLVVDYLYSSIRLDLNEMNTFWSRAESSQMVVIVRSLDWGLCRMMEVDRRVC